MNKTTIEWTDYTWSPVTGCHKVSPGCKNCYAETLNTRFGKGKSFREVVLHPERLAELRKSYRKLAGKKVFVCDVSDLFHESVPHEFLVDVFREFYYLPNTIFQILTKRPQRALEFLSWLWNEGADPLQNIWIGVSVEDQQRADERIPLLLQIPAAVRFLSCEPLLGEIDLDSQNKLYRVEGKVVLSAWKDLIHWVIAGGESGHGARPMHPAWVRSLRDQCNAAGVPFLFKQWGEYAPLNGIAEWAEYIPRDDHRYKVQGLGNVKYYQFGCGNGSQFVFKFGKSKSGNLLDGVQHLNFPPCN